jgi:hypothetical protein
VNQIGAPVAAVIKISFILLSFLACLERTYFFKTNFKHTVIYIVKIYLVILNLLKILIIRGIQVVMAVMRRGKMGGPPFSHVLIWVEQHPTTRRPGL